MSPPAQTSALRRRDLSRISAYCTAMPPSHRRPTSFQSRSLAAAVLRDPRLAGDVDLSVAGWAFARQVLPRVSCSPCVLQPLSPSSEHVATAGVREMCHVLEAQSLNGSPCHPAARRRNFAPVRSTMARMLAPDADDELALIRHAHRDAVTFAPGYDEVATSRRKHSENTSRWWVSPAINWVCAATRTEKTDDASPHPSPSSS